MKHLVYSIDMKLRNLLLYIIAFSWAAISTGCKDKDDDETPNPRIRRVIIPAIGNDVVFVINDVEAKIYNYDSLEYGTRVDSLSPNIYGYGANELKIHFTYDGTNFIEYKNKVVMDLTNPITVYSTASDGQQKSYTMEVRVHKYDVDAFEWRNVGTIASIGETIESHKSMTYKDTMLYFIQSSSKCAVMTSTDGKIWIEKSVVAPEKLLFSSLCNIGDSIYVQGESGAYYAANMNGFTFSAYNAISNGRLLYSLNNLLWVIDGNSINAYTTNGTLKSTTAFPAELSSDTIRPFTSQSGYTSLGYLYVKKGDNAEIWATDRYGNIECLTNASSNLPYLDKAIIFSYDKALGIIGGIDKNGKYSSECFLSDNNGLSWNNDWHKDLGEVVGTIADAGIFVTSNKGEMLLLGGQTENGASNVIWSARLKQILQREDFLNSLGK